MSTKCFTDTCIKLVTVNGSLFTLFKDSGMLNIIESIMKTLKLTVNSENIKDLVNNKANEVKNTIKAESERKLIFIKIDSVFLLG